MVGIGAGSDSREVRKHLAGDAGRRRRLNERRLRSDDCHRIRAAATLNRPGSAGGSTTKASARVTRGGAECSKRVRSDLESGAAASRRCIRQRPATLYASRALQQPTYCPSWARTRTLLIQSQRRGKLSRSTAEG